MSFCSRLVQPADRQSRLPLVPQQCPKHRLFQIINQHQRHKSLAQLQWGMLHRVFRMLMLLPLHFLHLHNLHSLHLSETRHTVLPRRQLLHKTLVGLHFQKFLIRRCLHLLSVVLWACPTWEWVCRIPLGLPRTLQVYFHQVLTWILLRFSSKSINFMRSLLCFRRHLRLMDFLHMCSHKLLLLQELHQM